VDTKKVRYVFREFPTPPQDIAVAGFLIARCAGEDKYFDVMHDIMASQKEWQAGVPPRTTLFRTAAAAGLSQEQTEACISDKAAIEEMSNRIKAGIDAGVTGTPTFIINGTKVLDSSLSGLSEAIDAELAKK
jgi:protein-disulfide isomerase